ncbi:MAG: hypothetical protein DMH00_11920 [Acidobacteria bacterium]|nr:MAG: hypothetical protein DMH00_11920 [Acidobacteriota bacterium]
MPRPKSPAHNRLVARAGLLILAAAAASGSALASAQAPLCEPSLQVRIALDSLDSESFARMPTGPRREAQAKRIRELLEEHPGDLFLYRSLQWKNTVKTGWREEFLGEYRRLTEERPGDPRFAYLYGRALQIAGDPKAVDQFRRAGEMDASFPWAHLGLADYYSGGPGKDPARLRKEVKRFWDLCPDTLEPYRMTGEGGTPRFSREAASRLRAILERRFDREAVEYYPILWSMEFKIHPSTEHDAVRKLIRQDLARIGSLVPADEKERYLTLREGCQMTGDLEGEKRAEKEFLDRFGYSDEALDIVMERWESDHPAPENRKSPEGREHLRTYYRDSAKWVKRWPKYPFPWLCRLEAAEELDDLPDKEVLVVVDGFLKAWREDPSTLSDTVPLEFIAARVYLRRGVRLDRVPSLIEEPLRKKEEEVKEEAASGEEERRWKESLLEYSRWTGWPLLVEAYLKLGRPPDAEKVVSRMEEALREKESKNQVPSPAPDGSGKEEQNRRLSPEEGEENHQVEQAWHRAETYYGKGRLAEAEKHGADAWACYRAGLLALPAGVGGNMGETREKIESDARRLWKSLGGTEEGWKVALERGPGEEQPAVKSIASGWQDRSTPLPRFDLLDLAGRRWTQADLLGKITFINVWATWCGPCRGELPQLQKLHEKLRGWPGVQLLTFNVDGNPGLVGPFLTRSGYTFPALLLADEYVERIMTPLSIPRNWIVDREGRLIREQTGFDAKGEAWVENALSEIEKASGATR